MLLLVLTVAALQGLVTSSAIARKEVAERQLLTVTVNNANGTNSTSNHTEPLTLGTNGGQLVDPTLQYGSTPASGDSPFATPLFQIPAPVHTLTPSVPPGHDDTDLAHLQPQTSQGLFFAQGPINCE